MRKRGRNSPPPSGKAPAIIRSMQFLPTLIILLLVVAFAVYASRQAKAREKKLAAWAAGRGLRFDPSRDPGAEAMFPEFECLKQGDNRYAYNRWQGEWAARQVRGFDYHYQTYVHTKHGRRTVHHHFSAVLVHSPFPLRPLLVRPEGILDKVGEFFGCDDIDFESAEFSRRFFVKAPDKRWAYDVLHARTMEYLLAQPSFALQFGMRHAIASRKGTFGGTLPPEDLEAAVGVLTGVLDRLPEYVVRELKGVS